MVFEICIEKQKPRKLLTYRVLTDFKNVVCGLDETQTYTLLIKVTFNEIGQIFSVRIGTRSRGFRVLHLFK